jgi:hypothetical protein
MQSLNVKLRRFTLGLGVVCCLNLLLVLYLFVGGNELVAMYAATLLVFLIPVTVGSVLFQQEMETTLDHLTEPEGDFPPTSYSEQGQLPISAD